MRYSSAFFTLVFGAACTSAQIVPVVSNAPVLSDTAMAGHWSGVAAIFVNWTTQRGLPVSITIHPDATVVGTVGDATLVDGRFHANRGPIGRALHLKTDWIVEGKLEGPIVAADSVYRPSVKIPLDWDGTTFNGGVNSSGSMFGGKDRMWLAAGRLVLRQD